MNTTLGNQHDERLHPAEVVRSKPLVNEISGVDAAVLSPAGTSDSRLLPPEPIHPYNIDGDT